MEHLTEILDKRQFEQAIIPDFGFNTENQSSEPVNDGQGWKLLLDYIQNHFKYERAENFVVARNKVKKEVEFLNNRRRNKNNKIK